jgi:hypothetical protein
LLTAGASDVNIQMAVARVLGARLCFAQLTAGANGVNIPRVVTRVRNEAGCAIVMAVKLGGVISPMLLEHSPESEESGESAELLAMCQTDNGKLVLLVRVAMLGAGVANSLYSI